MSNLSHQFDEMAEKYENAQRRRYARKKGVSGFIGNGYWFGTYPYMMGAYGAGTITQTQSNHYENPVEELGQNVGQTAGDYSGMGEGGTAVSGDTGGATA